MTYQLNLRNFITVSKARQDDVEGNCIDDAILEPLGT